MQTPAATLKRGFTLVELLTVVAIIALLIGILVPAVHRVRQTGKKTSSQNLLSVLAKGCEMFQKDFSRYPQSQAANPFEATAYQQPPSPFLSGAQWLILELAGADLRGYAAVDSERYADVIPGGGVNDLDWLAYYDPNTPAVSDEVHRFGPYANLDGSAAQSPEYFRDRTSATRTLPEALTHGSATAGSSLRSGGILPFAVDAFGGPVLYYRSNDQAKWPFTDWSVDPYKVGRYDPLDNTQFTSRDVGIDLGSGTGHALSSLGWTSQNPTSRPSPKTFAGRVYDQALYEQQQQQQQETTGGKVWPRHPDTFILILPGVDALYGTGDDITNF